MSRPRRTRRAATASRPHTFAVTAPTPAGPAAAGPAPLPALTRSTGSRHLERCPAPAVPTSSSTASIRSRTAPGRRRPPERGAAAIPPYGGRRAGRASSVPRGGTRPSVGRREPRWAEPLSARPGLSPPPGVTRRPGRVWGPRRFPAGAAGRHPLSPRGLLGAAPPWRRGRRWESGNAAGEALLGRPFPRCRWCRGGSTGFRGGRRGQTRLQAAARGSELGAGAWGCAVLSSPPCPGTAFPLPSGAASGTTAPGVVRAAPRSCADRGTRTWSKTRKDIRVFNQKWKGLSDLNIWSL